ncbi:M57 family metalloprotease [Gynurincola endophyticus]|uniref:M57 family metalloprotease n=1 Tax=Gynurincola endophyticus TaxID=2479004 RepID=UPI000F8C70F3|nr:M57 family metalloprotease [Gynurincola endophyticus]
MKNICLSVCCFLLLFTACQKNEIIPEDKTLVTDSDIEKITAMGFNPQGLQKVDKGFIVEGDIFIREDEAAYNGFSDQLEEYVVRTSRVTGLPRTITIRVAGSLPSSYITATDAAIARYNAVGLRITFARVTTGGNIVISGVASTSFLAIAGYPAGGNPYNSIQLSRTYLDSWVAPSVTTVIAHEIGHCIGFGHTDQYDPSYSCGSGGFEQPGYPSGGVVPIPGVPPGPSPDSWMLRCISNGINRPFTPTDLTVLRIIYG